MRQILIKINGFIAAFCGWLMLLMSLLLLLDVCARLIDKPLKGMAELSVFCMMIVVYLGLAHCQERNEHVSLELLTEFLSPRKARILKSISLFLVLVGVSLLFFSIYKDAVHSYLNKEMLTGAVEFVIWPVKFIMLFGTFLFWIQVFSDFLIVFLNLEINSISLS